MVLVSLLRTQAPALAVTALVALVAGCPAPPPVTEIEQRRSVRPPTMPADRTSAEPWLASSPTPRPSGFVAPPTPRSSPDPDQIVNTGAGLPGSGSGPCQAPGQVGTLSLDGRPIKPAGAAVDAEGHLWISLYDTHELVALAWTSACDWEVIRRVGGSARELNDPRGLAFDQTGRWLYVADYANHRVRRVDTRAAEPAVETYAGAGIGGFADGPAAEAWFWHPAAVAVDQSGAVYVADSYNHRIRKIAATAGGSLRVTTLLGGETGSGPDQFDKPAGVAVQLPARAPNASPTPAPSLMPGQIAPSAEARPVIFVADTLNHRIMRYAPPPPSPSPGAAAADAGSGGGSVGSSSSVIGAPGSQWVATVIAGAAGEQGFVDGPAAEARLSGPTGLLYEGGALWIADTGNHAVRRIGSALAPSPTVMTFVGTGGSGERDGALVDATFRFPQGLARGQRGELFVADTDNGRVRIVRGNQEAR